MYIVCWRTQSLSVLQIKMCIKNNLLGAFRNGNIDTDFSDMVRIPETGKIDNVS